MRLYLASNSTNLFRNGPVVFS